MVQIYLFLGLFVLGFIAQAGPRVVGSTLAPRAYSLIWIPLLVMGVIIAAIDPTSVLAKCLIAVVFLSAAYYLLQYFRNANPQLRLSAGSWLLFALVGFAASPFFNLTVPSGAFLFFWFVMVPIIIGAGQQFIAAFLGGTRCTIAQSKRLWLIYIIVALLNTVAVWLNGTTSWRVAGLGCLIFYLYYLNSTSSWRSFYRVVASPLALAYSYGTVWMLVGCLLLIVNPGVSIDLTVHQWSIGWAGTLIFAVSTQILRHMSSIDPVSSRFEMLYLTLWQLVPIGRGGMPGLQIQPVYSWVIVIAATIVISVWSVGLLRAEWRIISTLLDVERNTGRLGCVP